MPSDRHPRQLNQSSRWPTWACLALVAAAALAGCTSKNDAPHTSSSFSTTTASTSTSTDPCQTAGSCGNPLPVQGPKTLELNKCVGYYSSFPADTGKMQALMPDDGYSPIPLAGTTELAGIDIYICDSAVVDNQTVVRDFRMVQVSAQAHVPKEVGASDRNNLYEFQFIVNNEAIQSVFRNAGFKAELGVVEASLANQMLHSRITVNGTVIYDLQGVGQADSAPPTFVSPDRIHQSDGVRRGWANMTHTEMFSQAGMASVLTVHGSVVASMTTTASGTIAVKTAIVSVSSKFDFART